MVLRVWRRELMYDPRVKKDAIPAVIAILAVAAGTFALAKVRPDLPMTPSRPFVERTDAEGDGPTSGNVVIHVNGEGITQQEFESFLGGMPENQRQLFANPAGRRMLGEELVKLKLLEQEARKLGIADDPEVRARIAMVRAQLTASRALEQLVKQRSEQRLRAEFEKEKGKTLSLRHILVAYEGGGIPPREGGNAPTPADALTKASAIAARIRGGEDFAKVAAAESDDTQTAGAGGFLGPALPEMLPPEVAGVVRGMKPGSISEPVQTQFGVHVFKVEEPSFEDLRPMLEPRLQQQVAQEVLEELQKGAKVEFDREYFPPQPVSPQSPAEAPGEKG